MNEKLNGSNVHGESSLTSPIHPGSAVLRRAIRANLVSFPSQIPVLLKHPPADVQWRVVLLFFVRGWNSPEIAARFHVPKHQIWEILSEWCIRALALGYVQIVEPEAFEACCLVNAAEEQVSCDRVS